MLKTASVGHGNEIPSCKYFKLSWNTTRFNQSPFRNFLACIINGIILCSSSYFIRIFYNNNTRFILCLTTLACLPLHEGFLLSGDHLEVWVQVLTPGPSSWYPLLQLNLQSVPYDEMFMEQEGGLTTTAWEIPVMAGHVTSTEEHE